MDNPNDWRNAFQIGPNAVYESFKEACLKSVTKTGKLPSAEQGSQFGRAFQGAIGLGYPANIDTLKKVFKAFEAGPKEQFQKNLTREFPPKNTGTAAANIAGKTVGSIINQAIGGSGPSSGSSPAESADSTAGLSSTAGAAQYGPPRPPDEAAAAVTNAGGGGQYGPPRPPQYGPPLPPEEPERPRRGRQPKAARNESVLDSIISLLPTKLQRFIDSLDRFFKAFDATEKVVSKVTGKKSPVRAAEDIAAEGGRGGSIKRIMRLSKGMSKRWTPQGMGGAAEGVSAGAESVEVAGGAEAAGVTGGEAVGAGAGAATAAAGVAGGAETGAAVGSVVPGLGTIIGALVGAGAGLALASSVKGNGYIGYGLKGAAVGGMAGGMAGGMVGGPVGMAVGAGAGAGAGAGVMVKFVGELVLGAKEMETWVKGLRDANKALADFSPSQAMIAGQSEFADTMRKMKKGEDTAGSAEFLSQSTTSLEDTMAPIHALETTVSNIYGGVSAQLEEILIWPVAEMAEAVNDILAWLTWSDTKKEMGEPITLGKWAETIANDVKQKEEERPKFQPRSLPRT